MKRLGSTPRARSAHARGSNRLHAVATKPFHGSYRWPAVASNSTTAHSNSSSWLSIGLHQTFKPESMNARLTACSCRSYSVEANTASTSSPRVQADAGHSLGKESGRTLTIGVTSSIPKLAGAICGEVLRYPLAIDSHSAGNAYCEHITQYQSIYIMLDVIQWMP
jgi:hypothetical protein